MFSFIRPYGRPVPRSTLHCRLRERPNHHRHVHASRLSRPLLQRCPDSWYWDTAPPNPQNLAAAAHFYRHHLPRREWTGEEWKRHQGSAQLLIPEVIFLGRSNVGKSSVINALTLSDLNRVSSTPGATKSMAAWSLAARDRAGGARKGWDGDMKTKLSLVDMPGYGFGSRTQWGQAITTYLHGRQNLRRIFLLVDASRGVTDPDRQMLEILKGAVVPFQLVVTKCDRIAAQKAADVDTHAILTKIRLDAGLDQPGHSALGEIIAVGYLDGFTTRKGGLPSHAPRPGIGHLQWAILRAAGLDDYAMRKAESHGVWKPTPAPAASAGPLARPPESELASEQGPKSVNVPGTPLHESAAQLEAPTSSPEIVSDMNLEDFVKDIVGDSTKPLASPELPGTQSSRPTTSPATHRARVGQSLSKRR